jgi:predicted metal-binding protein
MNGWTPDTAYQKACEHRHYDPQVVAVARSHGHAPLDEHDQVVSIVLRKPLENVKAIYDAGCTCENEGECQYCKAEQNVSKKLKLYYIRS